MLTLSTPKVRIFVWLVRNIRDRESSPPSPTTTDPFAPEAIYEPKIDTNGDAVADIAYRVRFSSSANGALTATVRRAEGRVLAQRPESPPTLFGLTRRLAQALREQSSA